MGCGIEEKNCFFWIVILALEILIPGERVPFKSFSRLFYPYS